MKSRFFAVAAVMIGSQLQAQQDTTTLDPVILTANRFEQKQSQTGKVVTVISREQIERSGGKTVAQLLNEQAGISIAGAFTSAGNVQTLFTRGAGSGRTLLLLDGIPVSDPSMIYNEYDLNFISINEVERIEICRGAQSTLYGSDAIGGAINIITMKNGVSKPFNGKVVSSFGNRNTARNHVQFYGNLGKLTYTTRFAKLSTDGFSAAYDRSGNGDFDRDGFDGHMVQAALQYQVATSLQLKTFARQVRYGADVDAAGFADDKDFRVRNSNFSTGVGVVYKKGNTGITANYQYSELGRHFMNDSLHPRSFVSYSKNDYGARTQFLEVYSNVEAKQWLTLLAGADYRWATMRQDFLSISAGFPPYASEFGDSALHQLSGYASVIVHDPERRLNVELGGRINKHSKYGTNRTWSFNPSYAVSKGLRVFGSIATGFKAPSIYQVYDAFSGNPDLQPETSTNYEFGVQQSGKLFSSRVVYFHRDINNGIDYNYTSFRYFNFVRQEANGVELEMQLKPMKGISANINYTLLTGTEQIQNRQTNDKDTVYHYFLRRPKHSLNATIGYDLTKKWFMSVTAKAVSARYDIGGYLEQDVKLAGYWLFGAYSEYRCRPNLKFFADVQNLFDREFSDIRGYSVIPLLLSGGVSIQF